MHLVLLAFIICGAEAECEPGEVRARSCAAAEAYLRAGLREGQSLIISSCEEAPR